MGNLSIGAGFGAVIFALAVALISGFNKKYPLAIVMEAVGFLLFGVIIGLCIGGVS